jgi:hypothetical protein
MRLSMKSIRVRAAPGQRQRGGDCTDDDGVGSRALLFRDPDGNLINLFTFVTDEARAKFGL